MIEEIGFEPGEVGPAGTVIVNKAHADGAESGAVPHFSQCSKKSITRPTRQQLNIPYSGIATSRLQGSG